MDTPCEIWRGYIDKAGYGRDGKTLAHRAAYAAHKGPIPDGLHIHHVCGTRACVNPDHMTAMTLDQHLKIHFGSRDLSPVEVLEIKAAFVARQDKIEALIDSLAQKYDVRRGVIKRAIYKALPYIPIKDKLRYLKRGSQAPSL